MSYINHADHAMLELQPETLQKNHPATGDDLQLYFASASPTALFAFANLIECS
jgi:hypothetical protein